jgi:DNA-binding beta-propeller fold protein YncE
VSGAVAAIRRARRRTTLKDPTDGTVERMPGASMPLQLPIIAAIATVVACLALAIGPAPASAAWGFHSSFGEGESEPAFHEPVGVAVDEAGSGQVEAGSIYVGGLFSGLSGFNLADELISPSSFFGGSAEFTGVAVNPVNHNVYVVNASAHTLETFDPSTGAQLASFEIPGTPNIFEFWTAVEIAADAQGNVYVPDPSEGKVEVFDQTGGAPAGGVAAEIGVGSLSRPEGVAVDPEGHVWVADPGAAKIAEFSPDGSPIKEIAVPQVQAVALDGSGDIFGSIGGEEPYVVEYAASGGSVLAEFGKGTLAQALGLPDGVAVDGARGIVYVADNGHNRVDRFTSWAVRTSSASAVAVGRATMNGTVEVEPGTSVGSCIFEYGPTESYGESAPCTPAGPYGAETQVHAEVAGLAPGVDYHYRISATGPGASTQKGEDEAFGPPGIAGESAEAIVTTAVLRAHVTLPVEGAATCSAEYVGEAEFAQSGYAEATAVPCTAPIGSLSGTYDVRTAQITGLGPDSTYHYRFLASSQAGTLTGADETFSTFGIQSFGFEALGQGGDPDTQAGAHPYEMDDTFRLNTSTHTTANGVAVPLATDANPKDIITELPPGLIGNPDATPKCAPYDVAHAECSGATQVGVLELCTANPGRALEGQLECVTSVPVYNLVPPKGLAAQFGARFNGFVTVHIDARVRSSGDYGVTAEVINASAGEGVVMPEVTLWGLPAAESHDAERYCPVHGAVNEVPGCSERGPPVPFLSNPTACGGEREVRMSAEPWQQDEPPVVVSASAKMPAITGCGRLHFKPTIAITPTTEASDSPSGLDVELTVPQNEDPEGLATPDLKDAVVRLPPGLTVNPSSAAGLEGCTPQQFGLTSPVGTSPIHTSAGPAECPDASKVGSVEIDTPLIDHPLKGGVYVAQQGDAGAAHGSNPFGSMLALYIAIDDPQTGVVVKLAGKVSADPQSGQLTTTFADNPQLPFEDLRLDLFGGPGAPLTTPPSCGAKTTTADLTPWSSPEGADAFLSSSFQISSGAAGGTCPASEAEQPNHPRFEAGTENPVAGSYSPFVLRLSRENGSQRFSQIDATLPEGLLGRLAGLSECTDAQIARAAGRSHPGEGALEQASPSCPASSEVGTVDIGAGSGNPFHVQGRAYLAGPYKRAPLSLVIITPALAGPFDLGTVVVRTSLQVDPLSTQIHAISEPIPQILAGIPLDIRSITLDMSRPNFTLNPTNCTPTQVLGAATSTLGNLAPLSNPFQVGDCASLNFKPTLKLSLKGGTRRHTFPALKAVLTYPKQGAYANIKKAQVTLPHSEFLEQGHIGTVCTRVQFAAKACPKASIYGQAMAISPLLDKPVSGPVYLRSSSNPLPDLVAELNGQIDVVLAGKIDTGKDGGIRNTFLAVPDAPVSKFTLELKGGKKGLLVNSENICSKPQHATADFTGQNGKIYNTNPLISNSCGKKSKGSKKKSK